MNDPVVTDSDNRSKSAKATAVAVAVAAVLLVVAVGVLIAFSGEEPPSAYEAVFDPLVALEVSEDWWRHVIAGNDAAAESLSHPDGSFDFEDLRAMGPGGNTLVSIIMDSVPFGTTDAPQLCYILLTSEDQFTGSVAYRIDDGVWLPWEVRPDSANCYVPPRP